MATTEEGKVTQGIRVAIHGSEQRPDGTWYGPTGEAIEAPDGDGYLVRWDDGFEDHELVRWQFADSGLGPQFDLVRLDEGEDMTQENEAAAPAIEDVVTNDALTAALDELFDVFGETHNRKVEDEVIVPDLNKVKRFVLIEVIEPDADVENDGEVEIRLTSNGLYASEVGSLVSDLFFQINGQ